MDITRRTAVAALAVAPLAARAEAASVGAACDTALTRVLPVQAEVAVYSGLPGALNGGELSRRLDDYSPAGEAALRARLREVRHGFAPVAADAREKTYAATARAVFDRALATAGYPFGRVQPFGFAGHLPYVANQVGGPLTDTADQMIAQGRVTTVAEADAYVAKLADFARAFRGVAETVAADARAGVVPPAVIITRTLAGIDAFTSPDPATHPLVTGLASKLTVAVPDLATRTALLERARAAVAGSVYPGYAAVRAALVAVAPRASDDARVGMWAQPRGGEFYRMQARNLGDVRNSPAEIHELGRAEIARISAEMDGKLKRLGRASGTVGERMRALAAEPGQRFANDAAGRAAVLDYVRGRVRAAEATCPVWLSPGTIPRQPLDVRAVPAAKQLGAPGAFYDGPSIDGTRPGIYWLNLRDPARLSRLSLSTTSFHEGVPGHHTQGSVALSQGSVPVLLRIASFNAYQEGWALYAERLAHDLGLYRGDPAGDLGRLQAELFRAARLVVDTGLHALRWSRGQAITYVSAVTGQAASEVTAEVERYIAWPGQALGYKLGQLRLLEMAAEARARLGARWDIRRFHDAVLLDGARPLDAVAASVAMYV